MKLEMKLMKNFPSFRGVNRHRWQSLYQIILLYVYYYSVYIEGESRGRGDPKSQLYKIHVILTCGLAPRISVAFGELFTTNNSSVRLSKLN